MKAAGGRIARRYARALFELAVPSRLDSVLAVLTDFCELWQSDPQLRQALSDPAVPLGKRVEAIRAIARSVATKDESFSNFLALLLENNRLQDAPSILESFRDLVNEFNKTLSLEVTSAFPLSDQERSVIHGQIKAQLPAGYATSVEIQWRVDHDIIGGLVVRAGDKVLDSSLGGILTRIQKEMTV